jgi:hypothetical protein
MPSELRCEIRTVVACKAISVSRRAVGGIGRAVRQQILRARQSRLDDATIPDAVKPAMLGELSVMKGEDDLDIDPTPTGHCLVTSPELAESPGRHG